MATERIFIVAGGFLAVVLQLVVAPYIAVFSAMPNFIAAFAMTVAVVRPHSYGPVLPFVLGLAYDLMGTGPLGAMAFSLTLFSFLIARYADHVGNDSTVVSLAFAALGLLLVELSYGGFLSLLGYNANLFEGLAFRVAPCFVYDMLVALIVYPMAKRSIQPKRATRTDITQLR